MDKPPKKKTILWIVIGIGVVILLLALGSGNSNNTSTSNQTASAAPTVDPACVTALSDLQKQATTVSYKQLEKDPASYNGDVAIFTGQVLEIEQNGTDGIIRLSVTNEGDGFWSPNDALYIAYHTPTPVVDNDIVTITGTLTGSQTYTSQANFHITLPSMDTCGSDIQEASTTKTAVATPSLPVSAPKPVAATPVASAPTQPTTPVIPTPPATPAVWHTVYNDSDESQTNTPPFTLKGTQQKIDYSCTVLDSTNPYSSFNGSIESTQGLYSGYDNFAYVVNCPTSNATYEYSLSPGQYYLDLGPDNAHYTVTVEDYY